VVSYVGRFAPAVAVPLASSKGGEPATELTSSRSNTTNGDATLAGRRGSANFRLLSFAFNGRGGTFGHFEYRLAVTSPSVRVLYGGKGAVTCSTPHRIAVWSMGNT